MIVVAIAVVVLQILMYCRIAPSPPPRGSEGKPFPLSSFECLCFYMKKKLKNVALLFLDSSSSSISLRSIYQPVCRIPYSTCSSTFKMLFPAFLVVLLGMIMCTESSAPTSQPTAGIHPFSFSPSTAPSPEQAVTPTTAPLLVPSPASTGIPSQGESVMPSTSVAPIASTSPTSVSVSPSPSALPTSEVSILPTVAGTNVAEYGHCACSWTCTCDTNAVCNGELSPTAAPTVELQQPANI